MAKRTRISRGYDVECPKCGAGDFYPKRSVLVGYIPEPPAYSVECQVCGSEYTPSECVVGTQDTKITRY